MARSRPVRAREGFALLISMVALTILAVLVTDLHETTSTSFAASMATRDQLKAEYLAKSGVNLTRMLIGQEKNLRPLVSNVYQLLLGRPAPQLPVWRYANMVLKPFADFDGSREDVAGAGFDLDLSKGLGETGGTFEIRAVAENGKVNLNNPLLQDIAAGRNSVAGPLYGLVGGYQPSPNKFDPLFSQFDEKGRLATRSDVLANVIDWWDNDEQRSSFDPMLGKVDASGAEDLDYYRSQLEPYSIKNASFDTLEELRLVRGVGDDFWATFVEPDVDDPDSRQVTIYGGTRINPNEAAPSVLLSRVCSFTQLQTQPLCNDLLEQSKFNTLLQTARSIAPIPWFSKSSDFVGFLSGDPKGLYGKLTSLLSTMGMESMIFVPLVMPQDPEFTKQLRRTFGTSARVISIESTGRVGRSTRRIRTVVNMDEKWMPPPPNAGTRPPLGVFNYYRLD